MCVCVGVWALADGATLLLWISRPCLRPLNVCAVKFHCTDDICLGSVRANAQNEFVSMSNVLCSFLQIWTETDKQNNRYNFLLSNYVDCMRSRRHSRAWRLIILFSLHNSRIQFQYLSSNSISAHLHANALHRVHSHIAEQCTRCRSIHAFMFLTLCLCVAVTVSTKH